MRDEASSRQKIEMAGSGASQENLGDPIAMGEIDERHRGVLALQDSRFDVEAARKVEVLFDRRSCRG